MGRAGELCRPRIAGVHRDTDRHGEWVRVACACSCVGPVGLKSECVRVWLSAGVRVTCACVGPVGWKSVLVRMWLSAVVRVRVCAVTLGVRVSVGGSACESRCRCGYASACVSAQVHVRVGVRVGDYRIWC